jgi:hypothetical protein
VEALWQVGFGFAAQDGCNFLSDSTLNGWLVYGVLWWERDEQLLLCDARSRPINHLCADDSDRVMFTYCLSVLITMHSALVQELAECLAMSCNAMADEKEWCVPRGIGTELAIWRETYCDGTCPGTALDGDITKLIVVERRRHR